MEGLLLLLGVFLDRRVQPCLSDVMRRLRALYFSHNFVNSRFISMIFCYLNEMGFVFGTVWNTFISYKYFDCCIKLSDTPISKIHVNVLSFRLIPPNGYLDFLKSLFSENVWTMFKHRNTKFRYMKP
jgi:hypothetical protein